MRRLTILLCLVASPAWAYGSGGSAGAVTNAGSVVSLKATPEGHIETELHGPALLPFGSIHTERMFPVLQNDCIYSANITAATIQTITGTGGVAVSNQTCDVSTGAGSGASATMQSRRRIRYRPGQGSIARFTARFPEGGVADSVQLAGAGTAEATVGIGFNGTSLGVLHSTGGQREVRTLTVTAGAGGAENLTITLNSVAQSTCAVTGTSTTATAYQISKCTFTGWAAEQVGATVVFVRGTAGTASGTYSLANGGGGDTAAGTFAQTLAGAATTDDWTARAAWDDPLDGSGASGFTIDTTKLNPFQIDVAYLGGGPIVFKVLTVDSGNDPRWVTFHTLPFPNTLASGTNLSQPSLPILFTAYSLGSTTDISVETGSFAGFIEGDHYLNGPRFGVNSGTATVTTSTSAYTPLFTLRNTRYYSGRPNQAVTNILSLSAAANSVGNGITTFYLIRDATLSAGTPNFAQLATNSTTYVDTAATAVTFSNNAQVVWSHAVAADGQFDFRFSENQVLDLQPGETISLVARSLAATASVTGGINIREDQ